MGIIKHLMQEENNKVSTPSHLEKEMLIEIRKQLTTIQKILEDANEKHTDDSNSSISNRVQ